eukprot:15462182-Alexandrium_andersonii.AAC.1
MRAALAPLAKASNPRQTNFESMATCTGLQARRSTQSRAANSARCADCTAPSSLTPMFCERASPK